MITLFLNLILLSLVGSNNAPHYDDPESEPSTTTAREIVVTNRPPLNNVIEDYLENDSTIDANQYCIVIINNLDKGKFIRISKSESDTIDSRLRVYQYATVSGHTVLINDYSGQGYNSRGYDFKYSKPDKTIEIKTAIPNDKSKMLPELNTKFYYILDDIYAKYSQSEGWIWSDGKPDE